MAIKSALQSASRKLIGRAPDTFFGANGVFENELADLVNEVAADIAKYQDWQALVRLIYYDGNGTTDNFKLPPGYDRMLLDSVVRDDEALFCGYRRYQDINLFLVDKERGWLGVPGGWIIYGDGLHVSPAPSTGTQITFPYITKLWARPAGSNVATNDKTAFDRDTDNFLLPERLLMLGLVWRWRENKRLDASGDQEAFIKALDEYGAKDKGSFVLRRNSRRVFPGTYPAWPGVLGPATY